MLMLKRLRSLLLVTALGLLAGHAWAITPHLGSVAPLAASIFRPIPAGYRNVNHCGLVRITEAPAVPRHSLRTPYVCQAPIQSTGFAGLQTRNQDLKQRFSTAQSAWSISSLKTSSRPLRAHERRLSSVCSRQWSIRPPPTQSL